MPAILGLALLALTSGSAVLGLALCRAAALADEAMALALSEAPRGREQPPEVA